MASQNGVTCESTSTWWRDRDPTKPKVVLPLAATSGFRRALEDERITLAVASRQSSVLAFVSAVDGQCVANVSRVPGPMGLCMDGGVMAMGTAMALRVYQEVDIAVGESRTFVPVSMHLTGAVSIHDVAWGDAGELWFVNTLFSALCVTDVRASFQIRWQPAFAHGTGAIDCCHLNGMAMDRGKPSFFTALSNSGTREGWRAQVPDSGLVIGIDQQILTSGLSLPHSPKVVDGNLWLLEAGNGNVLRIDPVTGISEVACRIPGVLRGLDFSGRYAFVGLSKIRGTSAHVVDRLNERLSETKVCRIVAIDAANGDVVGHADMEFMEEISSVTVISGTSVDLIEPSNVQTASTFFHTSGPVP